MSASRIFVGISAIEVAKAPATLTALALGSCVAVILHDPLAKVGGLAHVLLPSTNVGRPRIDSPGRFAPTAVALLNERVIAMGAVSRRLTARLVGEAVGGDFGRSVDFDVETGKVIVSSYEHGKVEL